MKPPSVEINAAHMIVQQSVYEQPTYWAKPLGRRGKAPLRATRTTLWKVELSDFYKIKTQQALITSYYNLLIARINNIRYS
jgi:hypothetical protein